MKSRRRTIIKIVVLLLAGATLNVTVAWGVCIRDTRIEHVVLLGGTPLLGDLFLLHEPFWQAHGLPWKSLAQDNAALNDATMQGRRYSWNGGIRLDGPDWLIGIRPIALPLRPLWPGFAVNTLFYAGVLWVLFAGPFALRRMIRRRRGRCAACAYPIGQSPVCTECGAAVPKQ